MANCTTFNSILKDCNNNQGGIFSVWIANQSDVTYTVVTTAHTITAITTASTATQAFTPFEFRRNIGKSDAAAKIDLVNGSIVYEVNTDLEFTRREASKSRAITILGGGQRFLDIIYLDANGKYWLVEGAQLNKSDEATGVKRSDGSKYTVGFLAEMDHKPYEILASAITGGLLGTGSGL